MQDKPITTPDEILAELQIWVHDDVCGDLDTSNFTDREEKIMRLSVKHAKYRIDNNLKGFIPND
jgi:hypothetical protein